MKKCSRCHRDQDDSALICTYCGNLLVSETEYAATRALGDTDTEESVPRWGSANFSARTNLVIAIRDTATRFEYDADEIRELIIGRFDPDKNEAPDLDLKDYGGAEKGVSRRHAAIIRHNGALSIIDKGAPNGTFLNGQRLIANQPRILRDGDDVRLGYMVLSVRFERAARTP